MRCLHPYTVSAPGPSGGFDVPCGRCTPCRVARAQEWALRIVCERDYHAHAHFVTLTYAEEDLVRMSVNGVEYGTLVPIHMTNYIRELRRLYPPRFIKYFYCGEYGEKYGRPHYHAIFFGVSNADHFQSVWPYGQVDVGTVTTASARYCADYVLKSINLDFFANVERNLTRPFVRCSNGLGKQFAIDNEFDIRSRDFTMISDSGSRVGIPRYFRKVLNVTTEEFREACARSNRRLELYEYWSEKGDLDLCPDFASPVRFLDRVVLPRARAESARSLEAKRGLYDSAL